MQIQTRKNKRRSGFTLLEMLIVLAIILVIAAMVVPNLLGRQKKANIEATKASIAGLENALKLYSVDHQGEYPPGGDDIMLTLVEPEEDPRTGRLTEALLERMPVDAWGELMHYEYPNSKAQNMIKPAIWSSGPNKTDDNGSGDDINNWDEFMMQI